jgi:hypothetical protein
MTHDTAWNFSPKAYIAICDMPYALSVPYLQTKVRNAFDKVEEPTFLFYVVKCQILHQLIKLLLRHTRNSKF